ncbi:MAG: hypothetical protein JSU73_09935 [candidate division WOR-3 bacterium]|nr:MAG: hypothetical protein JSU73_09935 [candidate division WOR-3 bacterium]
MPGQKMVASGLLHSALGRRLAPRWLKRAVKSAIPYAAFRSEQFRREAEELFGGPIPVRSDYLSPYPFTIGVVTDTSYYFSHHVKACQEMRVAYRLVDICQGNWVELVRESGCDAFLASPSTLLSSLRHMFDERLRVLVEDMGYPLYPTYSELWLWESKRRMRDWLVAHEVSHPRTDVFYDRERALAFVEAAEYPLVCKTDTSAAAHGVFVLRNRRAARRMVRRAFGRGIRPREWDSRDRQRGCVLFQSYVPHHHEWRIVRIGDDYLCRRKTRVGDFASGSGEIGWAAPPRGLLDFAKSVTDEGRFTSMAVDVLVTAGDDGKPGYLVNELQCLIGAIKDPTKRNAHTGRWRLEGEDWRFEPGFFYQNACSNLRVAHVVRTLANMRGLSLATPIEVLPG